MPQQSKENGEVPASSRGGKESTDVNQTVIEDPFNDEPTTEVDPCTPNDEKPPVSKPTTSVRDVDETALSAPAANNTLGVSDSQREVLISLCGSNFVVPIEAAMQSQQHN